MSTGGQDVFEGRSKTVFRDYLLAKYPALDNWSQLISSIESVRLTNGQSNQIYFCELVVDPNDRLVSERDRKVVVRFFGSELTGSGNTFKTEDAKERSIHERVSRSLRLPKILYSFAKGRIEEFLKLESINLEEFENLSGKIAEILSKIHSLNMAGVVEPKGRGHLAEVFGHLYQSFTENSKCFDSITFEDDDLRENFRRLARFNYRKMIDWALKTDIKLNCKMLFTHNDVNRTNFHWLNDSVDQNGNKELIFIDFEYADFGYRWSDLANYLLEITIEKATENEQVVDSYFPNEDFCTRFYVNYLYNLRRNPGYQFDESVDNLDSLRVEVDFGCIAVNLVRLLWILGHEKLSDFKPNLWENAYLRWTLMRNQFEKFCMKYKDIL